MNNKCAQKSESPIILVVDDISANLKLITDILSRHGYQVRATSSGHLALRSVAAEAPDLILLDVIMPEMDGYEICRRLKADERSRMIPVIFISALEDTADKIKGFNAGAVDYITKPFQPVEVLARIDAHLSLRLLQKQLEAQNIKLQQAIQDITEQKLRAAAQDERLKFEAFLSALSAEFINTAISEVDAKVEKGLRTICDFLGVDRTTLSLFSIADGLLHVTYTYSLPEIGRPPAIIDNVVPEWVKMLRKGEMLHIDDIEDLPADQWCEKKYCKDMGGIKSILLIPLCVGGKILGTLAAVSYRRKKAWPHLFIQRFRLLGEIFANALERKRVDQDIQKAFAEIEQLKDRLEAENLYLRDKIDVELKQGEIVGQSAAMKRVLLQVKQVAATVSTVLIQGETGTGKELVAQAIHNQSDRKDRPMIKLNCAALPATLIEVELFGREKGAYTGASTRQAGRFEAAHGSTIFLDEIGELPLELQSKLLRVLQEGQFERLGSYTPVNVDVRVIAATNRDLTLAINEGRFRKDLFYRLNVFPILVPPLRERREDIQPLVWVMVKEFENVFGKTIERIQKKSMDSLEGYYWPGNVRELRNLVERAMILNIGPTLVIDLPDMVTTAVQRSISLKEIERMHILSVLERTGWRVRGENGAAEVLGLNPSTLEFRMKKLNIKRRTKEAASAESMDKG